MIKKIVLFSFIIFFSCKEEKTKKEPTIAIKKEIKPKHSLNKNFILGKFNYKKDTNFTIVNSKHSSKKLYLNKKVYTAFIKMYDQAKKEGISLKIISGTRNFTEQKNIWERKWEMYKSLAPLKRAKKILEFSSMPMTSRHHWGTDIDMNNLNNSYFEKGKGKKEYDWLVQNANQFGFYQVYTNKENGRTGYNLERWHWSYIPLAKQYLNYYNNEITYKNINDFKGAELAKKIAVISNYVNGISKKAK